MSLPRIKADSSPLQKLHLHHSCSPRGRGFARAPRRQWVEENGKTVDAYPGLECMGPSSRLGGQVRGVGMVPTVRILQAVLVSSQITPI